MLVREFVKSVYAKLPLDRSNEGKEHETFYLFMHHVYQKFITSLKTDVDEKNLVMCLDSRNSLFEYFRAPYTKERFVNCLKKICEQNLRILALCYKGNLFEANKALEKELFSACFGNYLVEHYIENIKFHIEENHVFFRMRDETIFDDKGNKNIVDNCWHVPFNLRNKVDMGRFSLSGYPCLYLGDDKKTCDSELGLLESDKRRWVASFKFKQSVLFYDLRIPSKEDIDRKDLFGLFQLLLNYPLISICSSKSHEKGFNEEYYFPQLFLHYLLSSRSKALSYKGIVYSSTKLSGGYNIVLPAFYKGLTPLEKGYSLELKDMLETNSPEIFK